MAVISKAQISSTPAPSSRLSPKFSSYVSSRILGFLIACARGGFTKGGIQRKLPPCSWLYLMKSSMRKGPAKPMVGSGPSAGGGAPAAERASNSIVKSGARCSTGSTTISAAVCAGGSAADRRALAGRFIHVARLAPEDNGLFDVGADVAAVGTGGCRAAAWCAFVEAAVADVAVLEPDSVAAPRGVYGGQKVGVAGPLVAVRPPGAGGGDEEVGGVRREGGERNAQCIMHNGWRRIPYRVWRTPASEGRVSDDDLLCMVASFWVCGR